MSKFCNEDYVNEVVEEFKESDPAVSINVRHFSRGLPPSAYLADDVVYGFIPFQLNEAKRI
jgi:hypothetical protein